MRRSEVMGFLEVIPPGALSHSTTSLADPLQGLGAHMLPRPSMFTCCEVHWLESSFFGLLLLPF